MIYLVVLCSLSALNLASANECVTDTTVDMKYNLMKYDCCLGYKLAIRRAETGDSVKSSCDPICEPPCENGKCTKPGECECLPGFSDKRLLKLNVCKPICKVPCVNSTCVKDGVCECHKGFSKVNKFTCKPDCSDCEHGVCIEPGRCECEEGYKRDTKEDIPSCIPICNPACTNGICTKPGVCTCLPGFSNKTAEHVCEPLCKVQCVNSTCVEDDTCECHQGYTKVNKFTCKPDCSDCEHGVCIEPGRCECEEGYKRDTKEDIPSCIPICNPACKNGNCTKPGVCTCLPGFSNKTSEHVCEPLCKVQCVNSTCVRDDTCECHQGFIEDKLDPLTCKPIHIHSGCPPGSTNIHIGSNGSLNGKPTIVSLDICNDILSTNQNETEAFPGLMAGIAPGYAIAVLLLLSVLVIGVLATINVYYRNRWTAYRVNSRNPAKHVILTDERGRIELEGVHTESLN